MMESFRTVRHFLPSDVLCPLLTSTTAPRRDSNFDLFSNVPAGHDRDLRQRGRARACLGYPWRWLSPCCRRTFAAGERRPRYGARLSSPSGAGATPFAGNRRFFFQCSECLLVVSVSEVVGMCISAVFVGRLAPCRVLVKARLTPRLRLACDTARNLS